jgi:dTDP-4-dehydrorhamnose reductase
MKILLTGVSGQLGRELLPQLEPLGSVTCVDRDVLPGDETTLCLDLGEFESVDKLLEDVRPDIIVNAAAYTAVDPAEENREIAFRLNAELPRRLADWAARNDSLLLHYSTDYVFSGTANRPYGEQDETGPLNVYGESKLAGEVAIANSGCRHLVVRTSWVYSGHGGNFVLTMLRLAAERPTLSVVSDQFGCPTWARNLAAASRRMLESALHGSGGDMQYGLYHYCDGDPVSWYGFARVIVDTAKKIGLMEQAPQIDAVTSQEFVQKAQRPGYSVLDVSRTRRVFGIEPAGLNGSLRACLEEIMHGKE